MVSPVPRVCYAEGGSRQCKSLPACHLAPAGVMLWHIGKWGGRVDKDFNRALKMGNGGLYVCHCHLPKSHSS